jgi:2-polyprenyl-6-methoxyphenol hydroxylase-like FAD-dependent oxidoreductase
MWTPKSAPRPNSERMKIFNETLSDFYEPWKSAAQWLEDDFPIKSKKVGKKKSKLCIIIAEMVVQYKVWRKIQSWNNFEGKVILAGDAAHSMVPCQRFVFSHPVSPINKCMGLTWAASWSASP